VTPTGEPLPETIPMIMMSVYIGESSSLGIDELESKSRCEASQSIARICDLERGSRGDVDVGGRKSNA